MRINCNTHIRTAIAILTFLMSAHCGYAQNNVYEINDECYKVFQQLTDYKQPEAVFRQKVDEMKAIALKTGDIKSIPLAECQMLLYYGDSHQLEKIRRQAEVLRKIAKETNHLQYYYFAYSQEIEHLLEHDIEESRKVAEKMLSEAQEGNYAHGLFLSNQILGVVYKAKQNAMYSKKYYKEALAIDPKLVPKQRTTPIYIKIAELTADIDSMMYYYNKGLEAAIEPLDSFTVYEAMSIMYGIRKNQKGFDKYNALAEQALSRLDRKHERARRAQAYEAAFNGEYDKAYKILDGEENVNLSNETYATGEQIAQWAGDNEKALSYAMKKGKYNFNTFNQHRGKEFAELNENIQNQHLKFLQTQRERKQQSLQNQNLLYEQKQNDLKSRNKRLENEAKKAALRNKIIEDSIERNITKIDNDRSKSENELTITKNKQAKRYTRILAIMILTLSLAILICIGFFIYYQRSGKHLLRYAKMLRAARNKATDASEMKNVFIQNMSHEIRTPLNAVMGFSQLMSVPGFPISDEEKVEYAKHILNNTKMLTMLVDDILNTGDIEKGNYSITNVECTVNEILAASISTAEYRAQDGVRVYPKIRNYHPIHD